MAMTNVCQKSICIYQDRSNKEFLFTVKVNLLTSAVANGYVYI